MDIYENLINRAREISDSNAYGVTDQQIDKVASALGLIVAEPEPEGDGT